MTADAHAHPSEAELLLFADGELPSRRHAQVRAHLDACWQCRTELDRLNGAIAAFIDYREHFITPAMPPFSTDGLADAAVAARLRDLEQAPAEAPRRSVFARLGRRLRRRRPHVARLALASAALLAAVLIVYQIQRPAVVSASELLQHAAREQAPRPDVPHGFRQTVRIGAGRRSVTREVWRRAGRSSITSSPVAEDAAAAPILSALARAGWDPTDPMDARAFRRWRDGATGVSDRVWRPAPGLLRLTSSATEGVLEEASLTVRSVDFHPVEQRLRFRRGEQAGGDASPEIDELQIQEIAFGRLDAPPTIVADGSRAEAAIEAPAPPAPHAAAPRAPEPAVDQDELELDTRYALQQLGADLGEPIDVDRARDGQVIVRASGVPAGRLAQLRRALPPVRIVSDAPSARAFASSARAAHEAASDVSVSGAPLPTEPTFEARFSRAEDRIQFENRVLAATESALLRAHALRRLADRYPEPEVQRLSASAQARLQEMRAQQARALCGAIGEARGLLQSVLPAPAAAGAGTDAGVAAAPSASTGDSTSASAPDPRDGAAATDAAVAPQSWQPAARHVLSAAQRLDRLASVLLADANTDLTFDQVTTQLSATLADVRQPCNALIR